MVSSRKQDAVDAVAQAFREGGFEALAIAADIGKPEAIEALVGETVERCGGIDILVNNAPANPVDGGYLAS